MQEKIRPGYKQTEVGVIPYDWDLRSLDSLVEAGRTIRYGIVQPGPFIPNSVLMLRSQDYSKGWTGPDEMHRVSPSLALQYRNAQIKAGDLIVTIVGAGIGQVVHAPDWLDGAVLSRSTGRVAIDRSKADPAFVQGILTGPLGVRQNP